MPSPVLVFSRILVHILPHSLSLAFFRGGKHAWQFSSFLPHHWNSQHLHQSQWKALPNIFPGLHDHQCEKITEREYSSFYQGKWVKGKVKHIVSTVFILFIVFLAWLLEWIGLSQIGLCEITETRKSYVQPFVPVFEIGFALVFIVFSLYSHRYFKVHMPEVSALNSRKY